ncbi:FUSC family protein [Propionibacterium ruminifibrarum]|uniref:FUSC family protein n=1 Tax=Propionibacterium ruminifibrarum TaxID=1962131 RepID=UPI0011C3ED77|nr:FUSC family protein [Propionibacterium ruminifibrarum]
MGTARRSAGRLGRSLIVLRPEPGRSIRAVRWCAAVATGLIASCLVFGPSLGAMGLIGAQAAHTGREAPMRNRITALLSVGLATLAMECIGALVSPYRWLMPPLFCLLTLVVVWTWHALLVGPPGPINTLFAAAFSAYMTANGYALTTLLRVTGFSWLTASLASVLILTTDLLAPEREAVDEADEAVSAYRDRPDDCAARHANRMRSRAVFAVNNAWHVLRTGRRRMTGRTAARRDVEERLMGIHLNLIDVLRSESFPTSSLDIGENFRRVPLGRPPVRYLLATALDRGSRPWLVAGRAALAVFLGSTMMIASPVGHAYWAILSSLIVLHMGASRADLTIRAAHRVIGTGAGVFCYFGIIALQPAPWVRVGIIVVMIYALEVIVTRNYALAVVFITVFSLMMTPVASRADITALMRDRFVETLIGVTAATLMIWLVGRSAPVLLVRSQYRRTLRRIEQVLADLADGRLLTRASREDRRTMVFELGRASQVLSSQRPDDPEALARWQSVQEEVNLFGFDVMASCWRRLPGGDPAAAQARRELSRLLDSLPRISPRTIETQAFTTQVRTIHRHYMSENSKRTRAGG